jgi:hypothetical protein
MHTIGFSGAKELPKNLDTIQLRYLLSQFRADRYVTGACMGIDALVGATLAALRPDALHLVIVPGNHNRIDRWWEHTPTAWAKPVVLFMPPVTNYAMRNLAIVSASDELVAFPAWPESDPRSRRSGTWQTVRMARERNLDVSHFLLHADLIGYGPRATTSRLTAPGGP